MINSATFDQYNLTALLMSLNLTHGNISSIALIDTNQTLPVIIGYVESILLRAVWGVIIILGTVGNSLVIFTMVRHGDRSATSYYIIDLALADLAFITISFPLTSSMFADKNWLYGAFMCKLVNYIILVTLHATCITLTAMTIDRYFAIVHPIRSIRNRTPKTSLLISLGIWIASLMVCVPYLIFYRQVVVPDSGVYCLMDDEYVLSLSSIIVVLTTYVVPLIIIVVCYTLILKHLWKSQYLYRRDDNTPMNGATQSTGNSQCDKRRKKVTKMVAIVVILFATFWLPIHAFNLCFVVWEDFPLTKVTMRIKMFALTLSYASSCVNPFVYAFMGDGFRRAFHRTFPQVSRNGRITPGLHSEAGQSATMETRLLHESRHTQSAKRKTPISRVEEIDEEHEVQDEAETVT